MRLEWDIIDINGYPGDLWCDWEELYQKYHSQNPMLSRHFVETLFEYYPQPIQVARGFIKGQLSTLLLLEPTRKGICRNYAPSQTQVALLLTTDQADFNMSGLIKALGYTCLRLDLYLLDPNEHQIALDIDANKQNYAVNTQVSIDGSFQLYWNKRSKNLRRNIQRYLKRLDAHSINTVFHENYTEKEILIATDQYGILESKGWKGREGTALHPSNQQGQFYRNLMMRFAKNNQAIVYECYINNKLAASLLCIFNNDTLITLKTTFDECIKEFSPGRVMMHSFIELLFKKNIANKIDFYTNSTQEQISWSTQQRRMFNITRYKHHSLSKFILGFKKKWSTPSSKQA